MELPPSIASPFYSPQMHWVIQAPLNQCSKLQSQVLSFYKDHQEACWVATGLIGMGLVWDRYFRNQRESRFKAMLSDEESVQWSEKPKDLSETYGLPLDQHCSVLVTASLEVFRLCIELRIPSLYSPKGDYEWPAMKKWNIEYLKQAAGPDLEVHVARNVVEYESTNYDVMKFSEFLDEIDRKDPKYGYISEFELFYHIPSLKKDVKFPYWQNCLLYYFGWIGKKDSATGMHWDQFDNTLTQVQGNKEIFMFAPSEGKHLYPSDKYDMGAVLSHVNFMSEDRDKKWPNIRNVKYTRLILKKGETLFIPSGYWHHVVNKSDLCISVNCQGYNHKNFWDGMKAQLLVILHELGFYKRQNCTCHDTKTGQGFQRTNLAW
jgi:hypothetical protein